MACELIVDVRESKLMTTLTQLSIPYTTASLDVGDFLIQGVDGEPLLVAERKSHADFAASNKDGRYREQRARLMAVRGSGVAVLYILEGVWTPTETKLYGNVSENTLKRLTTRLMLRYALPVLSSESILDTARWCRVLLSQLTDDASVFKPDDESASSGAMTSFTAALNVVKKGNKTASGTAGAMLSTVHGLGAKRVGALLQTTSIAELVGMTVEEIVGVGVNKKVAEALFESFRYKQTV